MTPARLIAVLCAASLIGCLGGDEDPDPDAVDAGPLRIAIEPANVVARQGQSVTLRVDTPEVPERNLPAGYAFDLDETVGDIDVTTAPCPAGTGTRACQDWTITPGARSVPGRYDVHVRTVGTRVGEDSASFELQVLLAAMPEYGAAVSVAASSTEGHVLVLNQAGAAFTLGNNVHAQSKLGYRRLPVPGLDYESYGREIYEPGVVTEFVAAPLPAGSWTQVAAIPGSSYAVRNDGTAWAWGANYQGEFGFTSSSQHVLFPQPVQELTNVRALLPGRVGVDAAFALLDDGTVQLWHPHHRPRQPLCEELTGTQCLRYFSDVRTMIGSASSVPYGRGIDPWGFGLMLKNDGSLWNSGPIPARIIAPTPTVAVAQDSERTLFMVDGNGDVWVKPLDADPEIKPGLSDIVAISTRPDVERSHQDIFALRRDGTVWTWNQYGQSPTPRQVPGLENVATLGGHYAITASCRNGGGTLWRIDSADGSPRAVLIPGFGTGEDCAPLSTDPLTVTVSGQGRVLSAPAGIDCTLACLGRFPRGAELRLHAVPATGWVFDHWAGDTCQVIRRGLPTSILLGQPSSCEAVFLPRDERLLTVRIDSGGRVTSDPPGIDCGVDCSEWFSRGAVVRLTAHPEPGYRFLSFTGDADCLNGEVTMDNVISCYALLTPYPAPLTPMGFAATANPIAVQLRWDAVDGPVVRYALERADASGVFAPIDTNIAGTAATYTDGSTTPNTAYTYRLTAFNVLGSSLPATATVTTGMLPASPGQGWSELGSALSATTEGPQSPSIVVDSNGVPTVAYVESTANIGRLFVRRFDGSTWQVLGGSALNPASGTGASHPSLALGLDGNPRVAFSQGNGQQQNIYVAGFDGLTWSSVGNGAPLNRTTGSNAVRPSLARNDSGRFSVAWIENGEVFVKTHDGSLPLWDSYAVAGPSSANAEAVQLAFAAGGEPLLAWRETVDGTSELRAARGFQMQLIGSVAGPVPSGELRDFGLIADLVTFGQGTMPWSIRTRRYESGAWLPLPDVVTDAQAPLQAMAMHRGAIDQGIALASQSGASDSVLIVYRREQTGWTPASTLLTSRTSTQLSLAMAAATSPVVALVENDAGTYRLRVFRYFP